MVPMLTCGFVRWNFAFATVDPLPLFGLLAYLVCGCCWLCRDLLRLWVTRRLSSRSAPRDFVPRCSLPCCLRDDFLCHVRGNLGVGIELHRVARPALRLGTQVTDVAEHLRQRDQSLHDPSATALFHRLDLTTPGVE